MPISYVIDAARQLVLTRGEGVVTPDDVIALRKRMQADPEFDPSCPQLFDLHDITAVEVSVQNLQRLSTTAAFNPGVRRAFVCRTEAQYGMSRVFAAFSAQQDQVINVFRDRAAAEAWLLEPSTP